MKSKKVGCPVGVGMTQSETGLGSFIRTRRLELALSQIQLADLADTDIPQNLISALEIGKQKYLNEQQLKGLAKALQCDAEKLLGCMPVKHTAQPKTGLTKFIRSRREELGLSLLAFAERMGMTLQKARALEVKRSPTISFVLARRLESALDLNPLTLAKFETVVCKQTESKLGQLIRNRRRERGMSLEALAEKLDVSHQFLSQIELGLCSLSENGDLVARLAQILKLDMKELEIARPKRRLKKIETTDPLGKFLATRRLELHLTQTEVGRRARVWPSVVSRVERGQLRPDLCLLDQLAKVLDNCQIPSELMLLHGDPPRRTVKDARSSEQRH